MFARRYSRRGFGAAALAATLLLSAAAFIPSRAAEPVFSTDGVAIEGTDPVAYFTEGKPVAGSPDFTHDYAGATWRFASAANRDTFAADPARYAPQYGGYCAWAVSQGRTASTDPSAWKIVGGLLYLNYSKNIQKRWSNDIPTNIQRGDANWPQLLAGEDPIYPAE